MVCVVECRNTAVCCASGCAVSDVWKIASSATALCGHVVKDILGVSIAVLLVLCLVLCNGMTILEGRVFLFFKNILRFVLVSLYCETARMFSNGRISVLI